MRPSRFVSRTRASGSLRNNRFLATTLALFSVLLCSGCPDAGHLTGKSDTVVPWGTWSGTLTATFTDNTSAGINLTYWIPPDGMAGYGVDNTYSAHLIYQQPTSDVLIVTINAPDISTDAFGSSALTVNYTIGSTTLTPTSASGQIPVGDRSHGLAVLKTIKSMSGVLSRTYTYQNNLAANFAILEGTVQYFDKFMYGVEGAVVSSSLDTRTTVADKNGYFFLVENFSQANNPNIYRYTVTFTKSGFRTTGWRDLYGNQKSNMQFELKPGTASVLYDRTKISLEGNVYAAAGGAPIAGAVVSTTADGRTAVTDAAGWFYILTSVDEVGHDDIYNVIIDAAGYSRLTRPISSNPNYPLARVP